MANAAAPKHILVLSDTTDLQTVIRELLEDEGYRVTIDAYLHGNIESVKRAAPDAIVIDCNRMELDESVAYLTTIRSLDHFREIPIIASTSAVRVIDAYESEVQALGLRVLRKPFDIEILADVVAKSFNGDGANAD